MEESNKGIGKNVIALGGVSFFTDISSEMIFPLLPIFVTSVLGAGKDLLGLIEGLADSTASLVEIFSGYFSDKTGKRKELVVMGYGLSSLLKLGIAFSTAWWHVLIMRALERIGKGIRTPPRDIIIAASTDKESRGRAFGLHRAMDRLGAIIGPAVALLLLGTFGSSETGYRTVFFGALIPALLAMIILIFLVKEPKNIKHTEKKYTFWEALKQMSPEYMNFLKVSLLFSLSYFSFAFFIVRATEVGIGAEMVVLLYIIYNLFYSFASIPVGMLSDKIGSKYVIAGAFVLYAFVCLGFIFAYDWVHFAVLFGLYGIFATSDESINKVYITNISNEENRGMAMGAYNTATGAAYLPASLIAGYVWATFGAPITFAIGATIAAVSAGLFCLKCKA